FAYHWDRIVWERSVRLAAAGEVLDLPVCADAEPHGDGANDELGFEHHAPGRGDDHRRGASQPLAQQALPDAMKRHLTLALLHVRRGSVGGPLERIVVVPELTTEPTCQEPPGRGLAGTHHPDQDDVAIASRHRENARAAGAPSRQPVTWVPSFGLRDAGGGRR